MPIKSTLDRGSHSGPNSAMPQRGLTSSTVLVPVLNLGLATDMLQLAGVFAAGPHSGPRSAAASLPDGLEPRIVVVGVVEVPADQSLTTGLVMARSYRALLDFLPSEVEANGRRVR